MEDKPGTLRAYVLQEDKRGPNLLAGRSTADVGTAKTLVTRRLARCVRIDWQEEIECP
jgi:hypothetical protein